MSRVHRIEDGINKKLETKVALLEQSTTHIHHGIDRIEKRFDLVDKKIDKLDEKGEANLRWMLLTYFGGFGSLFGMLAHIQHWF